MSKPAARLGDSTAHGGSITVGCPTVMIGGAPAARVGDMHVCPMWDGMKPHVGGPISMGSATVTIGARRPREWGTWPNAPGPRTRSSAAARRC